MKCAQCQCTNGRLKQTCIYVQKMIKIFNAVNLLLLSWALFDALVYVITIRKKVIYMIGLLVKRRWIARLLILNV